MKNGEVEYRVYGIHCASCELIIERRLLEIPEIKSVSISTKTGIVLIEHQGRKPEISFLNKYFSKEGYSFSGLKDIKADKDKINWLVIILSIIVAALAYLFVNKTGLSGAIRVDVKSSLPTFFVFGLLAGVSTCAALVGGIILGISKSWNKLYGTDSTMWYRAKPHLLFGFGRLFSYAIFGALLGGIGRFMRFSPSISGIIIIAVSLLMLVLALQTMGVKLFNILLPGAPKSLTRYIALNNNFKKSFAPPILGFLTFFLPCGFTLTVQSLALVSGSALQGTFILLAFAAGTFIPLLAIGLGSTKLYSVPKWSQTFSIIAAILLMVFAIFNFNAGLTVLGAKGIGNNSKPESSTSSGQPADSSEPTIQIIKMDASSSGYSPNYFKVKAGAPVRWEITDKGASGCTNAVISKDLFSGQIQLEYGKTISKEFTPSKPGKYRFSCWMGMVSGTIEVTK